MPSDSATRSWLAVVAGRDGLDTLTGLLKGSEDAWDAFQEHLPGARQAGVARVADEQASAQFFLQFLDGSRQRRLLDMQLLRRTGEVQFFGYGQEAAQMPKLHHALSSLLQGFGP